MKRLVFLALGSALVITMGGVSPAVADNGPHISTAVDQATSGVSVGADRCASCHRAHTAKGAYLLTRGQEGMCFTCHGNDAGGAATNVQGGVGYSSTDRSAASKGALRGGGFDYALIGSGVATKDMIPSTRRVGEFSATNQSIPALAAGEATTSSHSIGTAGTAWGNGAISATAPAGKAITLECGSCHDPHGNGNFRILRPLPVEAGVQIPHEAIAAKAAVAAVADNPATPANEAKAAVPAVAQVMTSATGIKIPDAGVKDYITGDYWKEIGDASVPKTVNGATVIAADGFIANISEWCSTCHTRYLAPSGSWETDSGDPTYKYRHTSNKIDVAATRNCITCHVAHGSNASARGASSSDVTQPDGTHVVGAAGSRLLRVDNRGICVMCHNV